MASDTNISWKTTFIISTSPQCDEPSQILLAQQHKIRRSDSILSSSFVSPLSGTAFLLATPEEFPAKLENAEFFERIEKFVQVHRNRFLLLQAPVYGKREWEILSSVQNRDHCLYTACALAVIFSWYPCRSSVRYRFFGCNLRVIPVHSTADVVKGMLVIVKATSKPNVVNLRDQMSLACTHIIDHSPVWKMLQEMQF